MCVCVCVCVFLCVCVSAYVTSYLCQCLIVLGTFPSQPTSRQASQSAIRLVNTKGVAALTFTSLNFLFYLFLYGLAVDTSLICLLL